MISAGESGIESIHALGSDISDVYHGSEHV